MRILPVLMIVAALFLAACGNGEAECNATPQADCLLTSETLINTVTSECTYYTYDAFGHVLTKQIAEGNAQGVCYAQRDECYSYSHDESGHLLTQYLDYGCDGGERSRCLKNTYDAAGRLLSEEPDGRCNGQPQFCWYYSYDAEGRLASKRFDNDCTGAPDSCSVYSYEQSAAGLVALEKSGTDCEGVFTHCALSRYDAAGHLLLLEARHPCTEKAAKADLYTYDAAGRLTSEAKDDNGDGLAERVCKKYDYDQAGHLIREQSMEICGLNGEGECILYDYDAEGRLVRERSNGWGSCDNGQGLFSNCQTYTYDAYGNLRSRQADDCLGRNPYSTTYTYQCTPKAAPAL